LSLDPSKPLIAGLAIGPSDDSARSILRDVQPCGVLTVGTRDLKPAGWMIFFDKVPTRPWQAYPLSIGRETARVVTEDGRTSIAFDGTSAGPFAGEFRFTFYPGGRLIRAAAVVSTMPVVFAPGRASTTQGWPSPCDIRSPMIRATRSAVAPVPAGTITRIGLEGNSCAVTLSVHDAAISAQEKIYPMVFFTKSYSASSTAQNSSGV